MRAFVADSSPTSRRVLRHILHDCGWQDVDEACTGVEILDLLSEPPEDLSLVVSEWDLEGATGLEVAQRAREADPEIPVVLITVRNSRTDVDQAVAAGVRAYFLKPLDPGQLADRFRMLAPRSESGLSEVPAATGQPDPGPQEEDARKAA